MEAHYDDVISSDGDPMIFAPGADDNASGVAALFEIARIFSQYNYHPQTSIELVAFAAEELMNYGNAGSEGYVNLATENEMDIKMMVNIDMIANTNNSDWRIKVFNYVGFGWVRDMAVDVIQNFTEIEPYIYDPMPEASGDCKYFYQAGIPCIYCMEKDFNSFYHSEDDLVANCEMDYCAEAVKIPLGLIIEADYMVTGLVNSENSSFIKVFPNPCHSKLKVTIPKLLMSENPSMMLSDIFGQAVLNNPKVESIKTILDVSNLSVGIYVLNIFTNERKETVLISVK